MTYRFFRRTPWLSIALIVGMTGCQSRARQTMVVEREDTAAQQPDGSTGGATTSGPDNNNADAGAAAGGNGADPNAVKDSAKGKLTVNGWTGEEDENAANNAWTVAKGSASVSTTAVASDTPASGSGVIVPSGTTAAAVTYDGRISSVLGSCTRCHGAGGTNQPAMDTYDTAKAAISRIIARSEPGGGMPPQGSVPAGDLQALKEWQAGGLQKSAAAGAVGSTGSTTPPAGNGLVLEITDQRYGNYLNQTVIQGRVGQKLTIVNKRSQGGFIIHTDGDPFEHGDVANPIPPGRSIEYTFRSPIQGEGSVYEHTDGTINTDRLIKLQVTQ